ncbi:family 16 glycosylhydrolase [Bacteroidota bacterium]
MRMNFTSFKKSLILLLFPVSIISQNYELVWLENFNGDEVDLGSWTYETGGNWYNNELQYYTNRAENSFIEDGKLVIVARKENFGGRNYTSARLKTQGKKFFKYGRIDARIKMPYGQGIWPAFWMMGENSSQAGWPACGEIDIVEMIGGQGNENVVHGTAHWEHDYQLASYGGTTVLGSGILADDFHIYSIEWNKDFIKWYFDSNPYVTIDITPNQLSEFHQEFYFIVNLAVGGNWPGNPDATTQFPQRMEIDYIRVFQDKSEYPKISFESPDNNQVFSVGSDIEFSFSVEDNGTITLVELFQCDGTLAELISEPFSYMLEGAYSGCYELSAKAVDNQGYETFTDPINITVGDECVEAPYLCKPFIVPGVFEAENFNLGGQGVAYNDSDAENNGWGYRQDEGVDIESSTEHGYNIGWTTEGEWYKYFIDVGIPGYYTIMSRVAAPNSGSSYIIEIDGQNVTGLVYIPESGDYQNWRTIETSGIYLNNGDHMMKFDCETGGFNINYFQIRLDMPTVVEAEEGTFLFDELSVYPNPLNSMSNISVSLSRESLVTVKLFDVLGNEVATVLDKGLFKPGSHNFKFDMNQLSSGVYIYYLFTDYIVKSKKVILMK